MPLKYQSEIDAFNFDFECPNNVSPIKEKVEVFRFSSDPINDENNFLPNVVFDRLNGGKFPYDLKGKDAMKCSRCGASYHYNMDLAKKAWNSMPEKRRENLKYTHLAKGYFIAGDGLVSEADNMSHFGFYESFNEDNDYLKKKFINLHPL